MSITKWDMLKLSSAFEGSFNPADFSEEELAEIEDDDKLDRIAAVFEERYNEEFYDEDD